MDNEKDDLAFEPIELTDNEKRLMEAREQLQIDNELQRKVANSEDVYKSELSELKNYGLKFELKGADPVGINGVIFLPNVVYTIGNRIISPEGIQLITNDIMNCALTIDSGAIRNENKIKESGGGTIEIIQGGGVVLTTTKT